MAERAWLSLTLSAGTADVVCGQKSDAIIYLKTSIARYGREIEELQQRMSDGVGSLTERVQLKLQHEQFAALIEDAARLLSQLGG